MRKTVLLASAALGAMFAAAPAMAQDVADAPQAEAADDGFGDAIVVTARRRAEDVSKVPIAITAFSGEQLVSKGIQSLGDLTKITPGLNISTGGSKVNPFVVIRGQSKAVTGNGSPGVIIYMNDVPLPGYGSLIQTYDMENVQVLKGPQGTLFGRNSVGGALLTVTKGARHEFGGYVSAEIAAHDYKQVEGAVNVPIVKDVLALRVAAQVGHDGGSIDSYLFSPYTVSTITPTADNPLGLVATPGQLVPGARKADEFAFESYRATLLFEPTDWFRNVTVGDYSKIRGQNNQTFNRAYPNGLFNNGVGQARFYMQPATIIAGLGGTDLGKTYANGFVVPLAQCAAGTINCNIFSAIAAGQNAISDRINFITQDPWRARAIIKGITNTTTIKLGDDHQIKNIFAIRTVDNFSNATLTGMPVPAITTGSQIRLKQTTEEIQLSGSFFDNTLKYTVGGFFYNEKPNGPGGYQALEVNTFMGLSHSLATTYLHNSSQAVYGQFDYSLDALIPGLTLTAGARQTWDTQSACTTNATFGLSAPSMVLTSPDNASVIPSEADCRNGAGIGPNNQTPTVFADAKFKKLTYTLGANWQITPDAMIYVAHRRGYRAGGYNTPRMDDFLANVQTFKPETLTDWEIGAKLRFASGEVRGTLDVAAFSGTSDNNQIPVSTSQLSGSAASCVADAVLGSFATNPVNRPTCNLVSAITFNGTTYAAGTAGHRVAIGGQTTSVNAAKLLIRGIEAAATLSPFRGLTFGGSISYTDIKTKGLTYDPALAAVMTFASRTLSTTVNPQGQPKWSSNASVTVEYPEDVLGGTLTAAADYHYNGSYRSVDIFVPSWHQIDLRVTLSDIASTGVSLSAYVKNLTDETVYTGTGSSSPSGIGLDSYVLGKPRTVGLLASYKFGAR